MFLLAVAILISSEISSISLTTEESLKNVLEKAWQGHLLACASGKESEVAKTLSAHRLRTIKNNMISARLTLTEEAIKGMNDSVPEHSKLIKVMQNGPTAGLLYIKDVEETDSGKKPRVTFIFLKFVKEATGWKVDLEKTFETNPTTQLMF